MKYDIIVIGDELLIGQVVDTNSGEIARMLTVQGWQLGETRVVGDDAVAIKAAITASLAEVDAVLMTGGLGPTKDDITKGVLLDYFGGELVYDEVVAANVERVFKARGLELNDLTRAQAWVPSSCRVINNLVGTAPLMWFERDGKVLVSMPGVPHETITMMREAVVPQLVARFNNGEHISHHTMVVAGIIESKLAELLADYEAGMPQWVKLAYLPSPGYIRLRLSASHVDRCLLDETMRSLVLRLHELLGDKIIADEDLSIAAIVGKALAARGMTVATAESCTGGNIAHHITLTPGSSDYYRGGVVAYSNDVKRNVLHVSAADLETHGAVSEPVVRQMARGVALLTASDCGIATSGIAGPGGAVPGKPVGTVWIAVAVGEHVQAQIHHFAGNRERVIERATTTALLMLLRQLNERE